MYVQLLHSSTSNCQNHLDSVTTAVILVFLCQTYLGLVGWVAHSWRNAGLWPANWPCPALDLQLMGDHYVGKSSATDQPTRPTQPFILPGSINE